MTRFKGIESYEAPVGDRYRLLPFKFTPLDSLTYVLTNMAGEFHLLPSETLRAFVRHQLPRNSSEYTDLRARHFLEDSIETAARDLLALKVRTRYQRLPEFTALHMFVVTLRCEHSCPYCQVSRQTEDRSAFDMTTQIADKSLDLVFRSPAGAIKIEFQGGEPLLNFDMSYYSGAKATERNQVARKQLRFVIATHLA